MCNDDEDDECCDCGCSPTFERRFMLTLVFSLITFCYVSYYFISVIPWEWYKTQWGWFNIILFNTFVGLLMIPPGATKEELLEAKKKKDSKSQPLSLKSLNPERVRYCFECKAYKPPRAHHCRDCNVCILAMDHHCPWVGNCVGHKNHKYFLLFLIWSTIGLSCLLITCLCRFIDGMQYYGSQANPQRNNFYAEYRGTPLGVTEIVLLTLNTFMTLPVTIAIVSLLFYQFSCVIVNQTSIEDYICGKTERAAKRAGLVPPPWPFHLGRLHNIRAKLGLNPWLWLIPVATPVGDGFKWKTRPGSSKQYEEDTQNPASILDPDSRRVAANRRNTESV